MLTEEEIEEICDDEVLYHEKVSVIKLLKLTFAFLVVENACQDLVYGQLALHSKLS